MKKYVIILSFLLMGCGSGVNKNKNMIDKQLQNVSVIEKQSDTNNINRLSMIGKLSVGVNESLIHTNIDVAAQLNDKISSLSEKISLRDEIEIKKLVKDLIAQNNSGKSELDKLNNTINDLQTKIKINDQNYNEQINKLKSESKLVANNADDLQSKLNEYTGWFGLKAILHGLRSLFVDGLLIFVVAGILYTILRLASSTNPIASTIFTVCTHIVSIPIHFIEKLFPDVLKVVDEVKNKISKKV